MVKVSGNKATKQPGTRLLIGLLAFALISFFSSHGEEALGVQSIGEGSYYNYRCLSPKEQEWYDSLLSGLVDMKSSIWVPVGDQDEIWKIFVAVMNDHPELYWVDYGYEGTIFLAFAQIMPQYNCTPEERADKDRQIEAATEAALSAIGSPEGDYEKARAVFKFVIDSVDYQVGVPDDQNLYSALVDHTSVCAGYSRMTQYLMQKVGLETLFVSGTVIDLGPHAWNIVRINDHYYQVDATFGDRAFSGDGPGNLPGELHYDYTYLCCDDSTMLAERTVDEDQMIPECGSSDLNFYQLNGIYYDSFARYDSAVREDMITSIQSGEHYFRCQFSNDEAYQAMMAEISGDSWYAKMLRDYGNLSENTIVTWNLSDDVNRIVCLWY